MFTSGTSAPRLHRNLHQLTSLFASWDSSCVSILIGFKIVPISEILDCTMKWKEGGSNNVEESMMGKEGKMGKEEKMEQDENTSLETSEDNNKIMKKPLKRKSFNQLDRVEENKQLVLIYNAKSKLPFNFYAARFCASLDENNFGTMPLIQGPALIMRMDGKSFSSRIWAEMDQVLVMEILPAFSKQKKNKKDDDDDEEMEVEV